MHRRCRVLRSSRLQLGGVARVGDAVCCSRFQLGGVARVGDAAVRCSRFQLGGVARVGDAVYRAAFSFSARRCRMRRRCRVLCISCFQLGHFFAASFYSLAMPCLRSCPLSRKIVPVPPLPNISLKLTLAMRCLRM